jgi:hypothetical protein
MFINLEPMAICKFYDSSIPKLGSLDLAVLVECIAAVETSMVDAVWLLRAAHPI